MGNPLAGKGLKYFTNSNSVNVFCCQFIQKDGFVFEGIYYFTLRPRKRFVIMMQIPVEKPILVEPVKMARLFSLDLW